MKAEWKVMSERNFDFYSYYMNTPTGCLIRCYEWGTDGCSESMQMVHGLNIINGEWAEIKQIKDDNGENPCISPV